MLQRISIILGSFIVAIFTMEIILRLISYYPNMVDNEMFIQTENELLPYKLKPNFEGYNLGEKLTIDSNGYRVVEPKVKVSTYKPSDINNKTILILGDSVAFGFGLSDSDTIASQLQSIINSENLNYKIINISVPGYSSWNEYEALREFLIDNTVDIVIPDYTVGIRKMKHEQTLVKVNTYVDKGIADVIQSLNNFDKLCTIESCEGEENSIVIFKYDLDNLESMATFVFKHFAPKIISEFGDQVDISMRMNTLGNLQGELLIKKPILDRFNDCLKQMLCEGDYLGLP